MFEPAGFLFDTYPELRLTALCMGIVQILIPILAPIVVHEVVHLRRRGFPGSVDDVANVTRSFAALLAHRRTIDSSNDRNFRLTLRQSD